jgi:cytochrome P450
MNYPTLNPSATRKTCPVIKGYPLIGVAPEFFLNPIQLLQRATKEYPGEVAVLNLGPIKTYLVTHPNHVQHVLNDNCNNFGKGEMMWKAVRRVMGNGILTSEGESWFRSRRLMQPLFAAKQINAFTELIVDLLTDSVANFEVAADNGSIDMAKEMLLLTQRILLGTLFGSSLERCKSEALADALQVIAREVGRRMFLSFLPTIVPLPGERALCNAIQTVDNIILSVIRERRQSGKDYNDLLGRLLHARDDESNTGMNDQQLRDECVSIYLAGVDTTATALTWIWYLLDEHPEVNCKLRAEINAVLDKRQPTFAAIANLQYTKLVIQEALRLYSPPWIFTRAAQADDLIDGYPIKAGATVLLSPLSTHRLPEFWDQPEVFAPERFASKNSTHQHPYAYIPFGGGPHHCIGKHLSMMEMQLIVSMIVQKYQLRRVPGHPIKVWAGNTTRLRYGLQMILQPI